MERKRFIKTSLLSTAGLTLLPTLVKSMNFNSNGIIELEANHHIRHGYYGEEYIVNSIDFGRLIEIRVDRFSNPEGDLSLLDLTYDGDNMRVGIDTESIFIESNTEIHEIPSNKSDLEFRWIKKGKVAISSFESLAGRNVDFKFIALLDSNKTDAFRCMKLGKDLGIRGNTRVIAFA